MGYLGIMRGVFKGVVRAYFWLDDRVYWYFIFSPIFEFT